MIDSTYAILSDEIKTRDQDGCPNGNLYQLMNMNTSRPLPIELIYLTTCSPGSIKGPHVHDAPKVDRFVCVSGKCLVVTCNEETQQYSLYYLDAAQPSMVVIPPGNAHAIASQEGCTVLSLCNERYIPDHYNQRESSFSDTIKQQITDYLNGK